MNTSGARYSGCVCGRFFLAEFKQCDQGSHGLGEGRRKNAGIHSKLSVKKPEASYYSPALIYRAGDMVQSIGRGFYKAPRIGRIEYGK